MHRLQIWVALPKDLEGMEPSFLHSDGDDLPTWEQDGALFKLIAGEVFGRKSPVPVYSPLYLIEITSDRECVLAIGKELFGESGLYILEGGIVDDGQRFGPKQLLVAKNPELCAFTLEPGTTVYLFGGEPFQEERLIHWNFVATSRELIDAARQRWIEQAFPKIEGETEFVPLPGTKA